MIISNLLCYTAQHIHNRISHTTGPLTLSNFIALEFFHCGDFESSNAAPLSAKEGRHYGRYYVLLCWVHTMYDVFCIKNYA
mgnify:CR=1 FL=1